MNEWNCPKKVNNTMDRLIMEEYTGVRVERECKRCGKVFTIKHKGQKFCCRECKTKYHLQMYNLKREHGNDFKKWLGKSIGEYYC